LDGGLFGVPITTTLSAQMSSGVSIAVADFNGDGRLDVAESIYPSTDVLIYFGNGDGTFGAPVHNDSGLFVNELICTKAADGKMLLTISGASPGAEVTGSVLAVGAFDGTGNLDIFSTPASIDEPQGTIAADLNHDGLPDFVSEGDVGLEVFLGNADGGWNAAVATPAWEAVLDYVGDFNEDGVPDLIAFDQARYDYADTPLLIFTGNGDGTFSDAGISVSTPSGFSWWRLADLNEDGHLDILNSSTDHSWWVLFGHGDGTFTSETSLPAIGDTSWFGWPDALRDIDGDGHLDLIVVDGTHVYVALGNGDGTFGAPIVLTLAGDGGAVPGATAIGDVNDDGKLDLVAVDSTTGDLSVFLNCR
jgi:hypothetical protein